MEILVSSSTLSTLTDRHAVMSRRIRATDATAVKQHRIATCEFSTVGLDMESYIHIYIGLRGLGLVDCRSTHGNRLSSVLLSRNVDLSTFALVTRMLVNQRHNVRDFCNFVSVQHLLIIRAFLSRKVYITWPLTKLSVPRPR